MKAEGRWSWLTQNGDIGQGREDRCKGGGGYRRDLRVGVEEQPGNCGSRVIPEGDAFDQRCETGRRLVNEELATLG
jgi:hypothetical protein